MKKLLTTGYLVDLGLEKLTEVLMRVRTLELL